MQFKAIIDNDGPGRVKYRIQHVADVGPQLRSAQVARHKEEQVAYNKKSEIRPQARLNMVTVMEIQQKYGINALNVKKDEEDRFWQILQTEYPQFLLTNKKVYRKPARSKIRFMPGTLA